MHRTPDAAVRAAVPKLKREPEDKRCIERHDGDNQHYREKKRDERNNDCAAHKHLRVVTRAADDFGRHFNRYVDFAGSPEGKPLSSVRASLRDSRIGKSLMADQPFPGCAQRTSVSCSAEVN